MTKQDRPTVNEELNFFTNRVKLAKYWSQSSFTIALFCLFIFLWSTDVLSFKFMFFTPENQIILRWVSIVIGILSLAFGYITFQGYRYGRQQLEDFVNSHDISKTH